MINTWDASFSVIVYHSDIPYDCITDMYSYGYNHVLISMTVDLDDWQSSQMLDNGSIPTRLAKCEKPNIYNNPEQK